jgi:hypothetical protein
MFNIINFISNIPSNFYSLGTGVIGYIKNHVVQKLTSQDFAANNDGFANQKIRHQCFKVSKRFQDQVGKVNEKKITFGHGEYILFFNTFQSKNKKISKGIYLKAYQIFCHYSPGAIINRGELSATEDCSNRYAIIRKRIKEIDSSLEIAFVPRTLYELILIRKCIEEDLENKSICPLSLFNNHNNSNSLSINFKNPFGKKQYQCWHLCFFDKFGDNHHPYVKEISYQINQVIVKLLSPKDGCFSMYELSRYYEREISFFRNYYAKSKKGDLDDSIKFSSYSTITKNFAHESLKGCIHPMGIRFQSDIQIINNAFALDCSKIAQKCFLLYRGGNFQNDFPYNRNNQNIAFSLSYGTSLFAGCIHDGGATPFHFMRTTSFEFLTKQQKDGYVIAVPFEQLNKSPFFIPTTNSIAQLFGKGEIFHARTKAWLGFDIKILGGMNIDGHEREHLKSNITRNELIDQFLRYKNESIQLKTI